MTRTIVAVLLVSLAVSGCEKMMTGKSKYESSQFGYSLKYGSGWSAETTPDMTMLARAKPDPARPGMNASVTTVTVQHIENPANLGLEALYAQVNADADRLLARAGAPAKQLSPIQFAGRPAVKITTPGIDSYKIYVAKTDGTVLDVSLDILGDESDRSFLPEAQAIVESMRLK